MSINYEPGRLTINLEEFKECDIASPPRMVGRLHISPNREWGYSIAFYKKPNFIHRYFMKLLLGWVWEDLKGENNE
jgi:hypothetical protein